jgi:hypothetical protein
MLAASAALLVCSAVSVVQAGKCPAVNCPNGAECPQLFCGATPCKCEDFGQMCNCLQDIGIEPEPIDPAQPLDP